MRPARRRTKRVIRALREQREQFAHLREVLKDLAVENKRLKAALVVATKAEMQRRDAMRRAG